MILLLNRVSEYRQHVHKKGRKEGIGIIDIVELYTTVYSLLPDNNRDSF